MRSAIVIILSLCFRANASTSSRRAIVPSSFMISQQRPTSLSPASRQRSTVASVCPARRRTPPSRACSGNMCPGRRKCSGFTPSFTDASAVIERSAAEMPVVVSTLSIETVKAVWWLSVFWTTICGRSSLRQNSALIGMQMSPFACVAMKLTFASVACSAAQMQSPSFSRSASSVTRMISPRLRASRQFSTVSNISRTRVNRLGAGLAHRAFGGGPGLRGHLHEGEHRDAAELDLAGGAVDKEDDAGDLRARSLHEVDGLLDASALGDDILDGDEAFALLQLKAAHREHGVGLAGGINALARHLLGEHALDVELARHLVSDEDAADGRRDDAVDARAELSALHGHTGHFATELLGDTRIAEYVRTLEIAVGMKLGAEFEMSLEESPRVLERLKYLFLSHFL